MSTASLRWFGFGRLKYLRIVALILAIGIGIPQAAMAQFGGGGLGGGGGGLGGGGGGGGTIGGGDTSGVAIDADGVLRRSVPDPTGRLMAMRLEQARSQANQELFQTSELRKVSLTRLIKQLDKAVSAGQGPDDAMLHLAGLTRIKYLFFYPETGDIVMAGPAEGWLEDPSGRVVGLESGRPVLELQDLAVALRTFAPQRSERPFVYCSIDPTAEGLSRMQQFLSQIGRQINPGADMNRVTQFIVEGLQETMGPQEITIGGVPATTHFAQILVEADYRMKLIGIGLEAPPVRMASYVAMANPATVARNALTRWFFVPDYERIKVAEDGNAAEFVGAGVKLVGEDELVGADGGRSGSGSQNRASRKFTRTFTDKYHQIAESSPVYAQLRNCIDLLVAAAFLQKHDWYEAAELDLGALGDESQYQVELHNAPRHVATAVNAIWKGSRLMTPLGGGVEIHAGLALENANLLTDDGSVSAAHSSVDLAELPADVWWWD